MSPAKLFADIKATADRFRAVPQRVAEDAAGRLTREMSRVKNMKGRKRSGDATPVENGILVRVFTSRPHVGPGWQTILQRAAQRAMRAAATGKG